MLNVLTKLAKAHNGSNTETPSIVTLLRFASLSLSRTPTISDTDIDSVSPHIHHLQLNAR